MTFDPAQAATFAPGDALAIQQKLDAMPYGGLVHSTRRVSGVAELVEWLESFRTQLVQASARNQANEADLRELHAQRAAIRSFLGTDEILKEL